MDLTTAAVILIIAINTPGQKPDIKYQEPMPTVEICMQEAERFLAMELPEFINADGISATCARRKHNESHT